MIAFLSYFSSCVLNALLGLSESILYKIMQSQIGCDIQIMGYRVETSVSGVRKETGFMGNKESHGPISLLNY